MVPLMLGLQNVHLTLGFSIAGKSQTFDDTLSSTWIFVVMVIGKINEDNLKALMFTTQLILIPLKKM